MVFSDIFSTFAPISPINWYGSISCAMKSLKDYRRSLSARLSVWTVLVVTAIFLAALTIMFTESRDHVRRDTLGVVRQTLDGTVLHIDNTLRGVEVAANNMLRVIENNLDQPDKMLDYSRLILENNPDIDGCSISFEPFYYKEKGQYFSAYSYNNGDSIQTENEGADSYRYHTKDWYQKPKKLNRPYWTEPYQENTTEGIVVHDIFSSYSQPIHDKAGKLVGVFSVDISLDWFSDTVSATKPFPNSFTILLGKGGTFLVPTDSTRQSYENVFASSLNNAEPAIEGLREAMIAGESGYRTMTINGELSHVFYKPFKNTGWSVAMVCPESDIYAAFHQLKRTVQLVTAIGLLLLLALGTFAFPVGGLVLVLVLFRPLAVRPLAVHLSAGERFLTGLLMMFLKLLILVPLILLSMFPVVGLLALLPFVGRYLFVRAKFLRALEPHILLTSPDNPKGD